MERQAKPNAGLDESAILAALSTVIDPITGKDVVSAGLISSLVIREGRVGFLITIAPKEEDIRAPLQDACREAVENVPGVTQATPVLTAERPAQEGATGPAGRKGAQWNLTPVEGVTRIIAVASGKGGVGKSTTSVQLAFAAQRAGLRAGLLDADIYGPSLPRMLNLHGKPELEDNKMIPLQRAGVQCISLGFLVGEDEAAVMRGPMLTKTLHQLLRGTAWGTTERPLYILFVDMPPGTGDVHLSLVQQVPLMHNKGGALIVTTPQDVAIADARRAIAMFDKVSVPLLGVVENMSWFEDPSGQKHSLFGEGGGQTLADRNKIPYLGSIPLMPALREACDRGSFDNNETANGYYDAIVKQLK